MSEDDKQVDEVAGDILTYWLDTQFWSKSEPKNPTSYYDDLWCKKWFAKEQLTEIVDRHIRTQFGEHVERALRGDYDHWGNDPYGAVAFIVLADQFTRNIFRGTARAWVGDAKALTICLQAIEKGLDMSRAMLYMPLLHAESSTLQSKSVELYSALYEEAKLKRSGAVSILNRFHGIAIRHRDSIDLFGRFPERNRYLGRTSTVAEEAYLSG